MFSSTGEAAGLLKQVERLHTLLLFRYYHLESERMPPTIQDSPQISLIKNILFEEIPGFLHMNIK